MTLFPGLRPVVPVAPAGIDLRCCDVVEVLREAKGVRLVHADPPWRYGQPAGAAHPDLQYSTLAMSDIRQHLEGALPSCDRDARMLVWNTWPMLGEWAEITHGWSWGRIKTGGSWHKQGPGGVGYHWVGDSEPLLLYTKGAPKCQTWDNLKNAHTSRREAHSEKPADWLRAMLRRWTDPGDLVLDLYAGLAPMARACFLEGRRYLGAEIDPERHRRALVALEGWLDD